MIHKYVIYSIAALLAAWWFRYDTHCTQYTCTSFDRLTGAWINPLVASKQSSADSQNIVINNESEVPSGEIEFTNAYPIGEIEVISSNKDLEADPPNKQPNTEKTKNSKK